MKIIHNKSYINEGFNVHFELKLFSTVLGVDSPSWSFCCFCYGVYSCSYEWGTNISETSCSLPLRVSFLNFRKTVSSLELLLPNSIFLGWWNNVMYKIMRSYESFWCHCQTERASLSANSFNRLGNTVWAAISTNWTELFLT